MTPWRRLGEWLGRVPIDDPVDRRNAPALQIVLLLLGILSPLMWLYRIFASNIPWRPGETQGLATDALISAVALAGVWLIRHGRLQFAVRQMLIVIAATTIVAYATNGVATGRYEQPLLVVWIVLAGLMAGRPALWGMFAATAVAFAVGEVFDACHRAGPHDSALNLLMDFMIHLAMFLLIAVVVDRAVKALRESLIEASQRGDALARTNRRLEVEMAERARTQEQLIHAQKVEVVGRLASGVAHDFNHLLALMLGYAAKGRTSDANAELKQALAGVEAAARRGMAVTHKLLDFSRHEATRAECFDAVDALRELQPMLRQLFDPGVRIVNDLPAGELPIRFDRTQFELVVLNIAANANQAMPQGGEFHIALRGIEAKSQVEIELRDTGHGMSETVQARLFEPFFTTRPPGLGTGLGLSVVHGVLTAHGGGITVSSAPGQGATFRIRLPLVPARQ
ncbi:MAG: ATP-binding protein [Rudaea sp.]|uniref:sensor histidine kinase n=1 Tax=Rudaea sp. TaxID=2136325 RepID=UPI0039E6A2CB